MIFPLAPEYDLTSEFDSDVLDMCNVPDYARKGYTSSSVLFMKKNDFKLVS